MGFFTMVSASHTGENFRDFDFLLKGKGLEAKIHSGSKKGPVGMITGPGTGGNERERSPKRAHIS